MGSKVPTRLRAPLCQQKQLPHEGREAGQDTWTLSPSQGETGVVQIHTREMLPAPGKLGRAEESNRAVQMQVGSGSDRILGVVPE